MTGARCRFVFDRMRERRRMGWHAWKARPQAEGDLALAVGNLDSAEQWYRRAIEEDAANLAPILELARISAARGDSSGASTWFSMFLDRGGPEAAGAGLPGGSPRANR